MDIVWFIIGTIAGFIVGVAQRQDNIPKDLEKCNVERSQQEIDIAYYKKLTKTLVEGNTELRRILNGNQKTSNKKS
jgi:hypothetical protein